MLAYPWMYSPITVDDYGTVAARWYNDYTGQETFVDDGRILGYSEYLAELASLKQVTPYRNDSAFLTFQGVNTTEKLAYMASHPFHAFAPDSAGQSLQYSQYLWALANLDKTKGFLAALSDAGLRQWYENDLVAVGEYLTRWGSPTGDFQFGYVFKYSPLEYAGAGTHSWQGPYQPAVVAGYGATFDAQQSPDAQAARDPGGSGGIMGSDFWTAASLAVAAWGGTAFLLESTATTTAAAAEVGAEAATAGEAVAGGELFSGTLGDTLAAYGAELPTLDYAATIADGLQAGAALAETATATAGATGTISEGLPMDELFTGDLDFSDVAQTDWSMDYDATIADGLKASSQLAQTAAQATSSTSLSDIFKSVTNTIRQGSSLLQSLKGSAAQLPRATQPQSYTQAGRINLGTVALLGLGFLVLQGS